MTMSMSCLFLCTLFGRATCWKCLRTPIMTILNLFLTQLHCQRITSPCSTPSSTGPPLLATILRLMHLRSARRMPSLTSTLTSPRRSFSSEDRQLRRAKLDFVSMAKTLFANISVPASSFYLQFSPGIICYACFLQDKNVPSKIADLLCETEILMLLGKFH